MNGSDSPKDVCQKTDNPISKNTVPFMKRKIDNSRLLIGSEGFWRGSGGFGSNRGTRDMSFWESREEKNDKKRG